MEGGVRREGVEGVESRRGWIRLIEGGESGEELLGIERRRGGIRFIEGGESGEEVDEAERRRETFLEVDVRLGETGDLGRPDRDLCRPAW